MHRLFFSFLVILGMLSACAAPAPAGPKIQVENAWARPTAGSMGAASPTPGMPGMPAMPESGPTSAVYFVIVNDGSAADALIGASSNVAKVVELHETLIKNNVAEMDPVAQVEIPAHGRIELKPGGFHLMLIGLTQDLTVGETLKLTLQFEKSGAIVLNVPIRQEQ